ncbi:hypothetical protein [Streptomyces sp. NPDC001137]|uniref:hypothetical protein n=1 Tax=Streptomyces sp. NPDC001137 TaxID=3154378 RepID=UPI003326A02C
MAVRTQDDLAALAEKGKRHKEIGGYTKAQVDVNVTDTTVSGQAATLQLTEHTRLYLPFTAQEVKQGAPKYEELSLPHTVKYTQGTDGTWLLSSDKADTGRPDSDDTGFRHGRQRRHGRRECLVDIAQSRTLTV